MFAQACHGLALLGLASWALRIEVHADQAAECIVCNNQYVSWSVAFHLRIMAHAAQDPLERQRASRRHCEHCARAGLFLCAALCRVHAEARCRYLQLLNLIDSTL